MGGEKEVWGWVINDWEKEVWGWVINDWEIKILCNHRVEIVKWFIWCFWYMVKLFK